MPILISFDWTASAFGSFTSSTPSRKLAVTSLVQVDDRHPDAAARSGCGARGAPQKAVEESIHLALDVTKGISLDDCSKWTLALNRHDCPPCS
jgi:hypothetical protein